MFAAKIKLAEAEVKSYSMQNEPLEFANAHIKLSNVYYQDACAAPGLTLSADKAIGHIELSLEVFAKMKMDSCEEVLANQHNFLQSMYMQRQAGMRADNVAKALASAKAAVKLCGKPGISQLCSPGVIPRLHSDISQIYVRGELANGHAEKYQDLAIRHQLAALSRYSKERDADDWGEVHVAVGSLYSIRDAGMTN